MRDNGIPPIYAHCSQNKLVDRVFSSNATHWIGRSKRLHLLKFKLKDQVTKVIAWFHNWQKQWDAHAIQQWMGGLHFSSMAVSEELGIGISYILGNIIRTELKTSSQHSLDPGSLMARLRLLMGSRAQTLQSWCNPHSEDFQHVWQLDTASRTVAGKIYQDKSIL